jgi:hypothetical protein
LHLCRVEPGNGGVEEFIRILITLAASAMTPDARLIVSHLTRDVAVLVQAFRQQDDLVSVVFRGGVQEYSIRPGYPNFGEDAGAIRLVEY